MGFVSPSASAKRRMAPFSTSLSAGLDFLPMALRSTTMVLLPAGGQVQDGDEAGVGPLHERRGVDHGPRGRLVARRAARDDALEAWVALELDLVAGILGPERDGELQVGDLAAVVKGARDLVHAADAAFGDAQVALAGQVF